MLMALAHRRPHLFWPLLAASIMLLVGGVLVLA